MWMRRELFMFFRRIEDPVRFACAGIAASWSLGVGVFTVDLGHEFNTTAKA
jgi:hypothetical protein